MRRASFFAVVLAAAAGIATDVSAAETAASSVAVSAQFSSRTSLRVSTDLLRFDVADPDRSATAAVEFSAGARTYSGAEVVLSVEPLRAVEGPGGAADDVPSSVSFSGEGAGTMAGALSSSSPSVAGRWLGSGLRQGRVVFALRAGLSGSYSVPVRFVLSAP
jgi:hypothetical protein